MRKHALLALILVASVLLSGCALVVKDQDVDNARVIVDVNGETADKQTVLAAYETNLSYAQQEAYMYYQYGLTSSYEVDEHEVLHETIESFVSRFVRLQKAKELGLDALDEHDEEHIQEDAQTEYDSYLEQVKSMDFAETTLEGDELQKALAEKLTEYGVTMEQITESVRETRVMDKLREHAIEGVTVTDEELQTLLDEKVESAKTTYASTLSSYGYSVNNGTTVYYAPAGYRYVKQILVKLLEEDNTAITDINKQLTTANTALTEANTAVTENETALTAENVTDDEKAALEGKKEELAAAVAEAQKTVDDLNAQLAAAKEKGYGAIKAKADDLYARAKAGEDFDALAKEFNEDTGMPEVGYAICDGYIYFDTAFTAPAMALENIGDVAEPSEGAYGYYITQYAADIPEGPVALESVRDTLHAEKLSAKQDEAFNAALEGWIAEGNVKTYEDRLED